MIRVGRSAGWAALICALCFAYILWLSHGMSFRLDDYPIAMDRAGWGWDELFAPLNEHWSTLTLLTFKALLLLVGLRDYMPYLAVLAAIHAAAAVALFAYTRRLAGDAIALGACVLFAFMAQAHEDFFWAVQVNFAGSALCGLIALIAVDVERPGRLRQTAGSLALLASLMFSGTGLLFMVMVATELGLRRRIRSHGVVLILPVLAYAAWFAAFGSHAANFRASLFAHTDFAWRLPFFIAYGVATAVTRPFELPILAAIPVLAALVLAVRRGWLAANSRRATIVAAAGAIITFYVLTGVERLSTSPDPPRYIYAVAPFVLVVVGGLLAPASWPMLRWVLPAGLALVTIANLVLLSYFAAGYRADAQARRDQLQSAVAFRDVPGVDLETRFSPTLLPAVSSSRYLAVIDRFGAPFPVATQDELLARRSRWVESALEGLFHVGLTPAPGSGAPSLDACSVLGPQTGARSVLLGGGSRLVAFSDGGAHIAYRLSINGSPPGMEHEGDLVAGVAQRLRVPDLGRAANWALDVRLERGESADLCPG